MRPHVNAYCAHENALHALTNRTFIRQQQQQQSYNLSRQQANNHPPLKNKWSTTQNSAHNLVRIHQQQPQQKQQQHAKQNLHFYQQQPPPQVPPLSTATNINNGTAYQLLPHATANIQQNHHQHQQQQQQQQNAQHKHLQRLNHYHHQKQQLQQQQHIGGNVATSSCGKFVTRAPGMPEALTHNYAKLPPYAVNQQRINECAGIPLISNATTHLAPTQRQRLMRKSSQSPPHILLPNQHQQQQQQQQQIHAQAQFLGLRNEVGNYTWGLPTPIQTVAIQTKSATSNNCNPQFVARTHAVPFLHHNNINNNNLNNNNNNNNNWQKNLIYPHDIRYSINAAAATWNFVTTPNNIKGTAKLEKSRLLRYQNSAPAALSTMCNVNKETTIVETKDENLNNMNNNHNSNSNNVESKVFVGDTCLPRIIKPRKRRKKDRKPTANATDVQNDATNTQLESWKNNINDNIWPLKAYKSNEDLNNNQLFVNNLTKLNDTHNFGTNCLMPFYQVDANPLYESNIAQENIEHNLRSIWDYPLRRSFSDSSATSNNVKNWDTASSASSTTSGSSSSSTPTSSSESPASSSRYSLSSSSADSFFNGDLSFSQNFNLSSRAEIVGVIGSNRGQNVNSCNVPDDDNAVLSKLKTNTPHKTMLSACLSDSNDSGYGDILTGINIVNDIFNHVKNSTSNIDNFLSIKNENNNNQNNNNNNNNAGMNATDAVASLLLLPETAETLLNESINEISRKLIETCGNELTDISDITTTTSLTTNILDLPHSAGSLGGFSTCSEFSNDSGVDINSNHNNTNNNSIKCDDLIFNFENLHLFHGATSNIIESNNFLENLQTPITAQTTATITTLSSSSSSTATKTKTITNITQFPTLSKIASTMDNFLMHLNVNNINEYNNNCIFDENNNLTQEQNQQQHPQELLHNHEYIKNCLDLVWTNVDGNEEVREPTATTILNAVEEFDTAFSLH